MPCLRIILPENRGQVTHILSGERITIGRRPENTIQVVDRSVSGHHAELVSNNGHYRLRDLGSTNRTCVDGQPITDFNLDRDCKVLLGSIECEYCLEVPKATDASAVEMVPTRAELEFLRRENLDLQSKIAAQQKQIDILSSAPLMTKQTSQLGVVPEVHRRVVAERDQLLKTNQDVARDLENLRGDLTATTRDRDAMRAAWGTVRSELTAAQARLASIGEPQGAPTPESSAETPGDTGGQSVPQAVLLKAPMALNALRGALKQVGPDKLDPAACSQLLEAAHNLKECTADLPGHPLQRTASAIDSLLCEVANTHEPIAGSALRTLKEASEVAALLLTPKFLNRSPEMSVPRVYALESDEELRAVMTAALGFSDIDLGGSPDPSEALAAIEESHFELILLGLDPGIGEVSTLTSKIRTFPGGKQLPVLVLAPEGSSLDLDAWKKQGADDFLLKPVDIVELTLKTHTWVYRNMLNRS